MNEIYLIIENESGYEAIPQEIGFVLDKESAEKKIQELTNDYNIALEYKAKLDIAREEIKSELEVPIFEQDLNIPKWKSGLSNSDITDEMRAERAKIISENNAVYERNKQKSIQYYNLIAEKLKIVFDKIPEEIKLYFNDDFTMRVYLNRNNPYTYKVVEKLN